jgi:hypothetical protein
LGLKLVGIKFKLRIVRIFVVIKEDKLTGDQADFQGVLWFGFRDGRGCFAVWATCDGRLPEGQVEQFMKIDAFDGSGGINRRIPKQIGGVEGIGLFSGNKGESRLWIPAHKSAADEDAVIVVSARVGGVPAGGVPVVAGGELYATEEVAFQFKSAFRRSRKRQRSLGMLESKVLELGMPTIIGVRSSHWFRMRKSPLNFSSFTQSPTMIFPAVTPAVSLIASAWISAASLSLSTPLRTSVSSRGLSSAAGSLTEPITSPEAKVIKQTILRIIWMLSPW